MIHAFLKLSELILQLIHKGWDQAVSVLEHYFICMFEDLGQAHQGRLFGSNEEVRDHIHRLGLGGVISEKCLIQFWLFFFLIFFEVLWDLGLQNFLLKGSSNEEELVEDFKDLAGQLLADARSFLAVFQGKVSAS